MLDFVLYHLLLASGVLLTLFFIAQILREHRPPAASLAWLIFIVTAPYLAIPLYLAIGVRKLRDPHKSALFSGRTRSPGTSDIADLDRLLDSYGIPVESTGNRVLFHQDGEAALRGLYALLEQARRRIDICIFILAADDVGHEVCRRLIARAREGVEVRLLLDGVGSFLLPKARIRDLRRAGIEVTWFIPVIHRPFKGRTNLRNHRKVVLVDGTSVWTGGRNLAKEYFDSQGYHGTPWLDLSFELHGPGAIDHQRLFEADWAFAVGRERRRLPDPSPASGISHTRLLPSGPDMPGDPLQALLLAACFEANSRILAVTPYFIPDESLQEGLCLAARRGVEVDLILPQRSNHLLPDIARRRYLRELAASGARIHLLPDAMVHAKALVMDERLALCGSANLDLRSLFLNFEAVTLFYHRDDIRWLSRWITSLAARGIEYSPSPPGSLQAMLEGMVVMLSFQL